MAFWSQDSANPSNGVRHAGDRSQRERADDCIYTGIWQRDSLSGQIEKFDVQFRPAALVLGPHHHPWIRFEGVAFPHFRRIVVGEVHAGPDADFKDCALRQRNDLLTNLL